MLCKIFLLASAALASASHERPLLGISLTARDLTIIQSLANGSTSLVARFSANTTYTSWFEQTPKLPEHEMGTVNSDALHEALLAAQYAVTQQLQQQEQFSIVTAPQEIHDPIIEAFSTLDLLAPLEVPATNYIRPTSAIHYAYNLGTCEAADLPQGCDPEDISGEVLWLDFNADSLSVHLMNFEEHASESRTESVFSGLTLDYLETTVERMSGALQKHFSDFLDQNTVLKDSPGRRGHGYKPLRSDIKAIVTSGDPLSGSLEAVELAIYRISPDLAKLIRKFVDPELALAAGAAIRARHMRDRPELYSAHICSFEDHSHDEL